MTPKDIEDYGRQIRLAELIIEHAKVLYGPASAASNQRLEELEKAVEELGYTPDKALEWEENLIRSLGMQGPFIQGAQRWLN